MSFACCKLFVICGGQDFLKTKAYPLLEGCAYFLLDWLIEGPDGYLETNPSTSPEHDFVAPDGKLASVSYSSTMDMELIRGVFSAVSAAAEVNTLVKYREQTILAFICLIVC